MAIAGVAGADRADQSVSGDAGVWFKDGAGKLNFLLCDGMGSGPAAREAILKLEDGDILLLDNVRFVAEEQTLFEMKLRLTHEQQAKTLLVEKLAPPGGPLRL